MKGPGVALRLIPIPNKNDNCVTLPCRAKALSAASRLVLVSIENWNEMTDLHKVIGVQRKSQTAWPRRCMTEA